MQVRKKARHVVCVKERVLAQRCTIRFRYKAPVPPFKKSQRLINIKPNVFLIYDVCIVAAQYGQAIEVLSIILTQLVENMLRLVVVFLDVATM